MTVEPMTDVDRIRAQWVDDLRRAVTVSKHDKHMQVSPLQVACLFKALDAERTRADAAEAERDAAVARAMPEPRLLRTVEEVEALPDIAARYMVRLKTDVRFDLWERFSPTVWGREHWRAPSGGLFPASFLVGALVSGPIPDLPTPTAAQEG